MIRMYWASLSAAQLAISPVRGLFKAQTCSATAPLIRCNVFVSHKTTGLHPASVDSGFWRERGQRTSLSKCTLGNVGYTANMTTCTKAALFEIFDKCKCAPLYYTFFMVDRKVS